METDEYFAAFFAAAPWRNWEGIFLNVLQRYLLHYFLIAGGAFLVFYVIWRRQFLGRKIQTLFPPAPALTREIFYSLISIGIFSLMGVVTLVMKRMGWTQYYSDVNQYGWGYLLFSIVALILLHDTWFYWTHRLMHWRPLYKLIHEVHHKSHNPTPWAAFAFHPLEALVEAAIFPVAIVLMPINSIAAGVWILYMVLMNVMGHAGFELFPKTFVRHWLGRWHNTSVHHNMHHKYYRCNYGLYFNLWDRLMKTNHKSYEQEFEKVASRSA